MTGFVYAIGRDDAVKIGWAKNPRRRLSELNVASPEPLSLIGFIPGGKFDESAAHLLCADERVRGEWFRRSGTVVEFIKTLCVPEPRRINPRLQRRHPVVVTALAKFMQDHDLDDASFALSLGNCQATAVRKWRLGERFPRKDQLRRIAEITNNDVTPNDFADFMPLSPQQTVEGDAA